MTKTCSKCKIEKDNSSKNGKLIPELIKHYQIKDLLPKGILQDT